MIIKSWSFYSFFMKPPLSYWYISNGWVFFMVFLFLRLIIFCFATYIVNELIWASVWYYFTPERIYFCHHQFRPWADHHNPIKDHDVSKTNSSSLLGLEPQGPEYMIKYVIRSLFLGTPRNTIWSSILIDKSSAQFLRKFLGFTTVQQQLYKMPVILPLSFTSPKSWPTYSYCLYSPLML